MSPDDLPEGRNLDEALLDVYTTGFASGVVTALVHLGVDPEQAQAIHQHLHNENVAHADEILPTLLPLLREAFTTAGDNDDGLNWSVVDISGDHS